MDHKKRTAEDVANDWHKNKEDVNATAKAEEDRKKAESEEAAAASSAAAKKSQEEKETEAKKKKDEEEKKQVEEQKKKDEEIMTKKDEDLSEEETTRKEEILAVKKKEDATKKKEEEKTELQKRFDTLTGEIKDLKTEKSADREKIDKLEKELGEVNKKLGRGSDPALGAKLDQLESDRLDKYSEEDVALPRGKRREMNRDEQEDFLADDPVEFQAWLTRREVRRDKERDLDQYKEESSVKVKELLDAQDKSRAIVEKKHPELNTDAREKELHAEGKSGEEITKILMGENPKYKLMLEILFESETSKDKYLSAPNGPELLMVEIEKRLEGQSSETDDEKKKREAEEAKKKKAEEEEAREREIADEAAEAERQRQEEAEDASGGSSTRDKLGHENSKDDYTKKVLELGKKAGLDPKKLENRIKEREKIPGTV